MANLSPMVSNVSRGQTLSSPIQLNKGMTANRQPSNFSSVPTATNAPYQPISAPSPASSGRSTSNPAALSGASSKPADDFNFYSQPYTSLPSNNQGYSAFNPSQPFAQTPENMAPNVAATGVAQARTQTPIEQAPLISDLTSQMQAFNNNLGTLDPNGQKFSLPLGTTDVSPYASSALETKSKQTLADFGIPQSVLEMMKVKEANQINQSSAASQAAQRRALAGSGLLNDSAMYKMMQEGEQGRLGQISNAYGNIDIQDALNANQGYQQNLNDLASGGMDLSKFNEGQRQFNTGMNEDLNKLGEQSRQFNITGLLDQAKLNDASTQWAEDARSKRTSLNEAVAQFLEDYDLQRQKMKAGLAAEDPQLIQERINALSPAFSQPSSYYFGQGGTSQ